MKQMIACIQRCAIRPIPSFAGEYYKRIFGMAKKRMLCDFCGAPISAGDPCAAETMGKISSGQPYRRWESDCIDIAPGQEEFVKDPKVVQVKVKQKIGVTHTTFMLIDGLHPFPPSNFALAEQWYGEGMLEPETAELVRVISQGIPVFFR